MKTPGALLAAAFMLLTVQCAEASAQCASKGTTHEQILRAHAIKKVMPSYPEGAERDGARGVAVVKVELGESGDVESVEVIQASHPLIEKAVSEAASQWKFKPFEAEGEPICVRGKLTFYFRIDDKGHGYVSNPKVYN